jgi:hypothetical protein
MIFQEVFDRFVRRRPIAVMFRALLDNVFSAEKIDAIFRASRRSQRDSKELLFSSVVRLLALAVCRVKSSVHAGYRDEQEKFQVSVNSVYGKLDKAEPQVAQALVRQPAAELESIIRQLKTTRPAPLPGYRMKILDGKHFSATDHRIAETQDSNSAPLPGQAIAVLDPESMLVTDVFPCEDGHAQERSILPEVLETVEAGQIWMGDRNFCTTGFVFGIANRNAYFLIRQHKQNLYWAPVGQRRRIGRSETGVVYEQTVRLTDSDADDADELTVRRVTIVLDTPTRDGDTEIHLLTEVLQIAFWCWKNWVNSVEHGEIRMAHAPRSEAWAARHDGRLPGRWRRAGYASHGGFADARDRGVANGSSRGRRSIWACLRQRLPASTFRRIRLRLDHRSPQNSSGYQSRVRGDDRPIVPESVPDRVPLGCGSLE